MPEDADGPPATGDRLLLRMVGSQRGRLAAFLALISCWQVCEAMVPVLIGVVIDQAVATGDAGRLALWLGVLVGLFAVLSYAYRFGAQIGFAAMQESMHELRMTVTRRALDPAGSRSRLLPGETLSLATSDVELIGVTLRVLGYAVASAVAVLVSAVLLVRIDLLLGLVVLGGVPAVLLLIQLVTPVLARRSGEQQAVLARTTGIATDLVRGFRTLKGIGAEDVAAARYRRESDRACTAGVRTADTYGVLAGLTTGASALFLAVVALLAGLLALEGRISVGELVAIVGLTQFLAEPMRILGDLLAELAAARASARRIVDYLRAPALVAGADAAPAGEPAETGLRLCDVYAGPLRGLSLTARPGELLGVVATDAEAAALVAALTGEATADAGEVRLDGRPLAAQPVADRRARLLVAPHRVDLFEGTLTTNVDPHGRHDAAALARLVEAAAVGDVLRLDPAGLDRHVSPDGATYSGGQRQRIAYARALAADVPTLVLHEPTTAVDAVTEHRMAQGLRATRHPAAGERTTWVLTSSPALLAQADRVVLLADGRVAAAGTHADLCARRDYREAVLR